MRSRSAFHPPYRMGTALLLRMTRDCAFGPEYARWAGSPPPGWVDAANRVMVASLAFPVELADQPVIQRYHRWLDSRVLREIRDNDPDRYQAIVEQIRSFIVGATEAKHE